MIHRGLPSDSSDPETGERAPEEAGDWPRASLVLPTHPPVATWSALPDEESGRSSNSSGQERSRERRDMAAAAAAAVAAVAGGSQADRGERGGDMGAARGLGSSPPSDRASTYLGARVSTPLANLAHRGSERSEAAPWLTPGSRAVGTAPPVPRAGSAANPSPPRQATPAGVLTCELVCPGGASLLGHPASGNVLLGEGELAASVDVLGARLPSLDLKFFRF
ncbi:hypothetical protein T484DRAFT_1798154 [Baffinella frigidus]|nr:hypothetical protein T484DRAFT_1798154 [Cryptophyta sp. CCMP2293]